MVKQQAIIIIYHLILLIIIKVKIAKEDEQTAEDQFKGFQAEKRMAEYFNECLGLSKNEVEQMLKKRKDLLSIGKSQANVFLTDLLENYEDVIKRQNRILNKTETYLSKLDNKEQIYDIILDNIRDNLRINVQKGQEQLNQTVCQILTKNKMRIDKQINKEVQCMLQPTIDTRQKAKDNFQDLYSKSKLEFMLQEIQSQQQQKFQDKLDALKAIEETDKNKITQQELQLKQAQEKIESITNEHKNVTQNMKNLMKEQVKSILAQDELQQRIDELTKLSEEQQENLTKYKTQISQNTEKYYSQVNEKGKDKYKLQMLEKKLIDSQRDNEELQIQQDHLKKNVEQYCEIIDKQQIVENELREIMVGKISEIRQLEKQCAAFEISDNEKKRQLEILMAAKNKLNQQIQQMQSQGMVVPENNEIVNQKPRINKIVNTVKNIINSNLVKNAVKQSPSKVGVRQSISSGNLLNKNVKKIQQQNLMKKFAANKIQSQTIIGKFKKNQDNITQLKDQLQNYVSSLILLSFYYYFQQKEDTIELTVQRISESSQEDDSQTQKSIKSQRSQRSQKSQKSQMNQKGYVNSARFRQQPVVLTKQAQHMKVNQNLIKQQEMKQMQEKKEKEIRLENKVLEKQKQVEKKAKRAQTPLQARKQIETNMSQFIKIPGIRDSVSQGGSNRRIQTSSLIPEKSIQTSNEKKGIRLSSEIQFTDQIGIHSSSTTPKIYPFRNVNKFVTELKDYQERLLKADIKDQVELKNQILCQFIKNHQKCGKNCEHKQDFYEKFGLFEDKDFSTKNLNQEQQTLQQLVQF